jgi:hypothetical protein
LALKQLREHWDSLPFAGLSTLLREVVERIIVKDDGIQVLLRP